MRHIRRLTLTAATALTLAGPVLAQDQITADTVVATVNGTDITVGHMIVLRTRLPAQYQQLPPEVLFDGILDQLVRQTLLAGSQEGLSTAARFILENEQRALQATEAAADIGEAAITEAAVEAAYESEYASAAPGQEFNASHILVETEEEAAALIEELSGGADFAELAREHSTGPSGPNGGELGWFGEGRMVAEFEAAVMALEPGEVSPPVQTQFGWHVVKLNETRQLEVPPLEAVREEIENGLREAALEAALAELSASGEVTRAEPGLIDPAAIADPILLKD